jgi:tetratricopeptide (TPR) repeat protein
MALTLAHEVDADTLRVKALWGLTLSHAEWDNWAEAIQAGAELQARAQRTVLRQSNHHMWALLALAAVAARMGDADTAERLAKTVAETTIAPAQYVEVARARLASARGEPRDAQQVLLNALDIRAGRHSMAALMAELAELAARGGDLDLYDRFGAEALELGWRSGARKALAQAIRARAIVGVSASRWEDALADAQNALARYRELGCAWEEARSRYVLAGLYRRRGEQSDDTRALDELTQALRLFDGLRAVRDIARVRSALAGGDVRLP